MNKGSKAVLANKARILQEAENLFAQKGYSDVSIRDISKATKLSHGAIYHHFQSKEDLFCELIEQKSEELSPIIRKSVAGKDTVRERLITMIAAYCAW